VQAPRCVWLVTVAFLFLLLSATVLYPPYRGPDELAHVDLVVALDHGVSPLWEPESRSTDLGVQAGALLPNVRLGSPQVLAEGTLPDRPDRVSYNDLGGRTSSGTNNQLVQHPPAYYLLLSGVLAVLPGWEDMPFDRVVGLLRVFTVLLVAPLPLVAHYTATRLTLLPVVPLMAAATVLAVPQLVHIGSSVNNDNLQNLLAGLCTAIVAFVASGDSSRRTAVAAGVVLGLGLLTKGLMLVFVGVLGLAYLVAWSRRRSWRTATSGLLALGIAFFIGGWWWLRNLIMYDRVQPSGRARSVEVVRGWGAEAWGWLGDFVVFVNARFWFDHPSGSSSGVSIWLGVAASVVVTVLVAHALWPASRTQLPAVAALAVVAVPLPLLLAVLLLGSYETFTYGGNQPALQGRYLFGGLVGFGVAASMGYARLLRGTWPVILLLPLGAWCAVAQLLAVFSAVRLYWWPADDRVGTLLSGLTRIMPWPDGVVLGVLAAAAVMAAAAGIETLRWASAGSGTRAGAAPDLARASAHGQGDTGKRDVRHGEQRP